MSDYQHTPAADLPAGSVIANAETAVFRVLDGPGVVWRATDGKRLEDARVDDLLTAGAQILRVGTNQGV